MPGDDPELSVGVFEYGEMVGTVVAAGLVAVGDTLGDVALLAADRLWSTSRIRTIVAGCSAYTFDACQATIWESSRNAPDWVSASPRARWSLSRSGVDGLYDGAESLTVPALRPVP